MIDNRRFPNDYVVATGDALVTGLTVPLRLLIALSVWFLAMMVSTAFAADDDNGDLFSGINARFISGGVPGGRATSIAADQSNPDVLYVGGAASGVWKTENGGMTWRPVFDDQSTSSIGTITVFQKNPDIVWVGTGEGKPRYGTGVGTGIFKSTDGGETWRNMGLKASERIQRVRLHPNNSNIVSAAVVGPASTDGEE
ncbi:MAG: hypothetical protein AAF850_10135, partial [Pseudomonadota bacterium]